MQTIDHPTPMVRDPRLGTVTLTPQQRFAMAYVLRLRQRTQGRKGRKMSWTRRLARAAGTLGLDRATIDRFCGVDRHRVTTLEKLAETYEYTSVDELMTEVDRFADSVFAGHHTETWPTQRMRSSRYDEVPVNNDLTAPAPITVQ